VRTYSALIEFEVQPKWTLTLSSSYILINSGVIVGGRVYNIRQSRYIQIIEVLL